MKELELRLLDRITDAFVALDEESRFVFVNAQAAELLEHDRLALLGRDIWTVFPALVGGGFHAACRQAMAQQAPTQIERFSTRLGRWIENRIYPAPDGLTIFFTDITERRQAEAALEAAALRLETLIASLQAGIIVEDDQAQLILANQAFCDMMGIGTPPGALIGSNVVPMARGTARLFTDPDGFIARALDLRRRREPVASEELRLADGRVWERDYVPVLASGESQGGHLWVFRDVTERRRAEERIADYAVVLEAKMRELEAANVRLEALATTDGLTGLLNHRVFEERLAEEFRRSTRYEEPLSLVLLDVDRFKAYNDDLGHLAGNGALAGLARVLRASIRETDLAFRFGGEEFALLLPHTGLDEASGLAERVREAVEAAPWERRAVTVSLGVCALTPEAGGPDALVASADAALYRAKAGGRNTVERA